MQRLIAQLALIVVVMLPLPAWSDQLNSLLFDMKFVQGKTQLTSETHRTIITYAKRLQVAQDAFRGRSDIRFAIVMDDQRDRLASDLNQQREEMIRRYFANYGVDIAETRIAPTLGPDDFRIEVQSDKPQHVWECPWTAQLYFPGTAGHGSVKVTASSIEALGLPQGVAYSFEPSVDKQVEWQVMWRKDVQAQFTRVPKTRRVTSEGDFVLQLFAPSAASRSLSSRGAANTAAAASIGRVAECQIQLKKMN